MMMKSKNRNHNSQINNKILILMKKKNYNPNNLIYNNYNNLINKYDLTIN